MIKYCLCLLLFFSILENFAQGTHVGPADIRSNREILCNVSPPDVNAFERYSFLPVDLHTGRVSVSIPIYTIKEGDLEYPISINYQGGGIKVNQPSSNVGLGWSLTNSVITRKIIGYNDLNDYGHRYSEIGNNTLASEEQRSSERGFDRIGYFKQSTENISLDEWDFHKANVDFYPDIYSLYSPDFKTNFYFDAGDFSNFEKSYGREMLYQGSKIKAFADTITFDYMERLADHVTKDFFKFEITRNDGTKYTFEDYGVAHLAKGNESGYLVYASEHTLPEVSNWYISKIKSHDNREIQFEYETYSSDAYKVNDDAVNASVYLSFQRIPNTNNFSEYNCFYKHGGRFTNSVPTYTWNVNKIYTRHLISKRIKRITFSSGKIEFFYNRNRIDLYNEKALTDIVVRNHQGKIIHHYSLDYEYFNSNCSDNSYDCNRLKLISINDRGTLPYEFEYIENISLPRKSSFSVDFLGYYNNSYSASNFEDYNGTQPIPRMYFYPNKEEFSLLPFELPNENALEMAGIFDRRANDFSKAWSLKKITYPKGGWSEFEYEPHDFFLLGNNILGGGCRLKKQKLINDGRIRELNYEYKHENGNSTGEINNIPYFGFPVEQFYTSYYDTDDGHIISNYNGLSNWEEDELYKRFSIQDKGRINEDINNGGYVTYSKVIEKEVGNGRTEYFYDMGKKNKMNRNSFIDSLMSNIRQSCMGEFLIINSAMSNNIYTDNSLTRGGLIKKEMYNEENLLNKRIINKYNSPVIGTNTITGVEHVNTYKIAFGNLSAETFFSSTKKYREEQYLKAQSQIIEYFDNDSITTTKDIVYDDELPLVKEEKTTNSLGENIKVDYKYPTDVYPDFNPSYHFGYDAFDPNFALLYSNMLNTPLEIKSYRNNQLISSKKNKYKISDFNGICMQGELPNNCAHVVGSYRVYPDSLLTSKGNNELQPKITYDRYDTRGNLLQYTLEKGMPVSIIWGYDNQYPIAKIEGAIYSQIESEVENLQALSNADIDENSENTLYNALKDFRNNHTDFMITTYTYDPLIGVTSITPPNGQTVYYAYDGFGRLKSVKDEAGNKVQDIQYHYRAIPE